jgi:putative YpdA family bacillithiol system oxidoreductase
MEILFRLIHFVVDHIVAITFAAAIFYPLTMMLRREKHQRYAKKYLAKAVKTGMNEPLTLHPEVDPGLCSGCGACTHVCPEGDILRLINNKAVLVSPTKCVGHGECERACPMSAITLVHGTKTRGMDIPRVSTHFETNVPGLYIAGELGGMGLIRNAIKQGVLAGEHALQNLSGGSADYDVIIVGAGPAGFAAGLCAIAKKQRYLLIEQNSLGGTVYNFPRQKIVMSHPLELPIVGKKQFENNKVSKDELLDYWHKIQKKTGLKIKEKVKFENLEKVSGLFKVKTSAGEFTAKKVILAMGVRGSPRRLGVPGEDSAKVTYNLLDPEQYQRKNVIVVGGGNAAAEAAQMLGEARWNNTVHLLVREPVFDRCNEDNIKRVEKLEKQGRIKVWFKSSIQSITADKVSVQKNGELVDLPNDYVFIFAGAEMPHKFLMNFGIEIDKKFGEAASGSWIRK